MAYSVAAARGVGGSRSVCGSCLLLVVANGSTLSGGCRADLAAAICFSVFNSVLSHLFGVLVA
jgi:hypothetical protein